MLTFATAFDQIPKQVRYRLLIAVALSSLFHLSLLGVPVISAGTVRDGVSIVSARLEPASAIESTQNHAESFGAEMMPATRDDYLARPDAGAPRIRTKPEPRSAQSFAAGGGIELPAVRDPIYYAARQLDVYPLPLTPFKLGYPAAAGNARLDGRLLVLLLIDEFGSVNEASIVEADPSGYFEEAALSVFRAAHFSPAQRQGKPVKSRALLQVKYIYGESQAAVR